jgi:eukaryotic-like serine/threonine-protein kinase
MTDDQRHPEHPRKSDVVPATALLTETGDKTLADGGTAFAPSCPLPLSTTAADVAPLALNDIQPGTRLDDFEIISLLGRGAFGAVYLARQLSLERQVALKVTVCGHHVPSARADNSGEKGDERLVGGEGRKMARLEHENIVQVFSETAYDRRTRLLCMQYVAGSTLQAVLDELASYPAGELSGQKLLDTVDGLVARPAEFDPAAMRNRELLARLDWVETVCWIGSRLAEALDYAHTRGVIHRDIKPGNIMINQYGRPLLVDFNLAFQPFDASASSASAGGTLAYMAPEHLDAFAAEVDDPKETVAQAADIYSLGVVLYQCLSGTLPFTNTPPGKSKREIVRAMAAERRQLPPPLPAERAHCTQGGRAVDQVIARCLHADPALRFGSARELSAALDGCRHYQAAEAAMPDFGGFREIVMRRPAIWLFILALAPHVFGSLLNILYNYIRIISTELSPPQKDAFFRLVAIYNPIGFSIGIALALWVVLPVARAWPLAGGRLPEDRRRIDAARRTATTWPTWAGGIACLCWFPGGIVFPLVITLASQPLPVADWIHLLISFWLSGLIAATYSMHFVEWVTLCVTYPKLWCDRQGFRATAAEELRSVPAFLRLLQVLAGLIPLLSAVLILISSSAESLSFRLLVAGLIMFGMVGSYLSMYTTGLLYQAWAALTGQSEGVRS